MAYIASLERGRMISHLLQKLKSLAEINQSDELRLAALYEGAQRCNAENVLVVEGERPKNLIVFVDAWGYRFKTSLDGNRQILGYFAPGDTSDVDLFAFHKVDFGVAVLKAGSVLAINEEDYNQLAQTNPRLALALARSTAVNHAVMRQLLTNLAQKDAIGRLSHFICELWTRLHLIGETKGFSFDLPFKQDQLANMLGLTPVHLNRTLRRLREEKYITLFWKVMTIENVEALRKRASFESSYLQLGRT